MIPTTPPGERLQRLPRILLWGLLGAVLVGVVGLGLWSLLWQEPTHQLLPGALSARLPVYGTVPDFGLIDQRGHPVQRSDLGGKIWIANFIFTYCPDECPLMTAEMGQLQSDLADVPDLRLVSITVDPERDTPAVLSRFAERFHADPARWIFLTGDKRAIYRLAREGFRLGIVDPTEHPHPSQGDGRHLGTPRRTSDQPLPSPRGWLSSWSPDLRRWLREIEPSTAFADHGLAKEALHSTRFVLVDRRAQIRGYYESREGAALQRLRQHLQLLFRES
jgi:cytochrome oxidase Cu insertion factor (SCO1/SenC/PrrC family)